MTATDTTPTLAWLDQAEAEHAAEEAQINADSARIAASMANDVNERLDQLGITPTTPARADGDNIVPALIVAADNEREFHGVHCTFDEEDGIVLLVSDHDRNGYSGLRRTYGHLDGIRSVLAARRNGPRKEPAPVPPLPRDTRAIIDALDRLTHAVESVARNVGRP